MKAKATLNKSTLTPNINKVKLIKPSPLTPPVSGKSHGGIFPAIRKGKK